MKLADCVTIITNNEECVIFKVKPNQFMNLVSFGCFDGDETMFRLTKGQTITCTVWHGADNKSYSWHWGYGGYTLVSDAMSKRGRMIQRMAEEMGIRVKR